MAHCHDCPDPRGDCLTGQFLCEVVKEAHETRPRIPEQTANRPRPDMPLVQPRAETDRTRPIMPGGIAYVADAGTPLPEQPLGEHPALPENWHPLGYAAPQVTITENNEHALPLQIRETLDVEITNWGPHTLDALVGPAPLGPPVYKVSFDGENAYRCPICHSEEWEITTDEQSMYEGSVELTMTCRHHRERDHL